VPVSSGVGDLLVTIDVAVPDKLGPAEREAVQQLGDLMKGDSLRDHLWGDE
jgi:DnaJ-class molecular chaperone